MRSEAAVPFIELDLGEHDIILGRRWLAWNDVLPDARRHQLSWPDSRPALREPETEVLDGSSLRGGTTKREEANHAASEPPTTDKKGCNRPPLPENTPREDATTKVQDEAPKMAC
ncbi:hypothetical protein E4U52_000822, partial [Claviceps spartinae]